MEITWPRFGKGSRWNEKPKQHLLPLVPSELHLCLAGDGDTGSAQQTAGKKPLLSDTGLEVVKPLLMSLSTKMCYSINSHSVKLEQEERYDFMQIHKHLKADY